MQVQTTLLDNFLDTISLILIHTLSRLNKNRTAKEPQTKGSYGMLLRDFKLCTLQGFLLK